ncbi:MAG: DUF167 domain-containing protein [Limisphaerales bacterium]
MPPYLRESAEGLYLSVKLQPRASRNQIQGLHGNELKIAVTAPPVDSAANSALLDFLAAQLGLPRSAIQLVRGQTSRHKTIFIAGVRAVDVAPRLVS